MQNHSANITRIAVSAGITVTDCQPVGGGDINAAYCLHTKTGKYFLKLNEAARYPGMFEQEAAGLEALRLNSRVRIPAVLQHGTNGDQQWLILEWLEPGIVGRNSMENFGRSLAAMHRSPQSYFGWKTDNYIGSLPQLNTPKENWPEFYTGCRLLPLLKILFDKKILSRQDLLAAEAFCRKTSLLFPDEPPALLHGDLWAGNYMMDEDGHAVLFDPAVYYGHREMDIGMSLLFGGFSPAFYDAYGEVYPLVQGWKQRVSLTQLYPLLVHAVLFGGSYISEVKRNLQPHM